MQFRRAIVAGVAVAWLAACGIAFPLTGFTGGADSADGASPDASDERAAEGAAADAGLVGCTVHAGATDGAPPPSKVNCSDGGLPVDLQTSGTSCGACNRSCYGETCSLGRCGPETVAADPTLSYFGPTRVGDAVRFTSAVFSNPSSWDVIEISDAGTSTLASFPIPAGSILVGALHEPPNVTFQTLEGFFVGSVTDPDAGLSGLLEAASDPDGFVVTHDGILYAIDNYRRRITKVDRANHAATTFAALEQNTHAIAADDEAVYWITDADDAGVTRQLRRQRRDAPTVETLYEADFLGVVSVDDAFVYFTTHDPDDTHADLLRISKNAQQEPVALGTFTGGADRSLALDAVTDPETIYWAIEGNAGDVLVLEVPRCGGVPLYTLSIAQVKTPLSPAGQYYYWGASGRLMRGVR